MLKIKSVLSIKFKISDYSELYHFLKIQMIYDQANWRVSLNHSQLANQILIRFGMSECKPVIILLDPSIQLKYHNHQSIKLYFNK